MTLHLDIFNEIGTGALPVIPDRTAAGQVRASRDIEVFNDIWPRSSDHRGARCHVFQCADVLTVWLDTVGAARKVDPHFVVVSDTGGKPWFALALGIERRYGVRVLTFLDGGVADYNAPVVFAGAPAGRAFPLPSLIEQLRRVLPPFDLALLEKMPAEVIDCPNPLVTAGMTPHLPSGHAMALAGSWQDYAANRLPRRQDTRRKRRKLEAAGKLAFVVAGDGAARERLLAAMIRQKTARYIETRGWDGFDRPGYREYFSQMTQRLDERTIHLSALELDGEPIATHWGMIAGLRFYSLMPGFDSDWNKFSPGRLLTENLIEWSYARGLDCFDFGVGDETYKFEFRDHVLPLFRAVMPVTIAGSAFVFAINRKNDLKRSRAWRWLRSLRARPAAADTASAAS